MTKQLPVEPRVERVWEEMDTLLSCKLILSHPRVRDSTKEGRRSLLKKIALRTLIWLPFLVSFWSSRSD